MSNSFTLDESAERLRPTGSRGRSVGSVLNLSRRTSTGISDVSHFTQRRLSSVLNGPQWTLLTAAVGDAVVGDRNTNPLHERKGPVDLPSGSRYDGTWDSLGITGAGEFTMPHGVRYTGEFHDNCCKGFGILTYSNGAEIRVLYTKEWNENMNDSTYRMTKLTYFFKDELRFVETDWEYCTNPDRRSLPNGFPALTPGHVRFQVEIQEGLQPMCTERRTQRQPTPPLPPGCYDTGEGVFNPRTWCLTDHDSGEIIRVPTTEERDWIMKNCRTSRDFVVGYRPELYENWNEGSAETVIENAGSVERLPDDVSDYSDVPASVDADADADGEGDGGVCTPRASTGTGPMVAFLETG